jgi:acetyltransferase
VSVRNLDALFQPRAIAIVGASTRPGSVGGMLTRNLLGAGFAGPVMPVNPRHRAVAGVLAYPDVAALPLTPALAVIASPPETVPGIVAALAARGTRAAVVITAGFRERDAQLRQAMLDAARARLMRIVGPNCIGLLVPPAGINASFAPLVPPAGPLAFVAQSGAVVTAVLDWAHPRGIGFSHVVSLGDMADVDFGDMLDYLAADPATSAILLYVEAVTSARKFVSAARAAARAKPVVVVKAGRHAQSAQAAATHTGALAGNDAVYDAVFRRTGMLRVHTLDELFAAAEVLASAVRPAGNRLAILSNGGGIAVMAADALLDAGGTLATLAPDTLARLARALPRTWSGGNPVDIVGDATGERYVAALGPLLEDPGVDGLLVLHAPVAVTTARAAAADITAALPRPPPKTVLACWVGQHHALAGRAEFARARIPTADTPERAVQAFMYLVEYRRRQDILMQTPPSVPERFLPDRARADALIADALAAGREWLDAHDALALLAAYGVPVIAARAIADPDGAAAAAAEIGGSVALKLRSPDITHKTEVGGVALGLASPAAVREAAQAMLARVRELRPDARIEGFLVEPMVRRAHTHELIAGIHVDALFGPVVLFGQGGVVVDAAGDTALALPPLNLHLARELIAGTRIARLLEPLRGQPGADLDALALTLVKVAQLAADCAALHELDINPLLAGPDGVIALDARVRIAPAAGEGAARLAIRPYPSELEETVTAPDGTRFLLRPIRPEDEPALQENFQRLTPEQRRLRFFVPMRELRHPTAARLTQIDYDREMALVLTDDAPAGDAPIRGVVRIAADPDNERAEFAVAVEQAFTGRGLGRLLMERIIAYARARGIAEIYGDVLRENEPMRRLCVGLGMQARAHPDEPAQVRMHLAFAPPLAQSAR